MSDRPDEGFDDGDFDDGDFDDGDFDDGDFDDGGSAYGTASTRPGRPPILLLLEAFGLRRNARIGFATGFALAVAAYLFRVLELWGPFAGTREYPIIGPEGWFLLLAVVLAVALGLLVTVGLTVAAAIGQIRAQTKE